MLRGEQIDAATALRYGLVNQVVRRAELEQAALDVADRLLARSGTALEVVKSSVLAARRPAPGRGLPRRGPPGPEGVRQRRRARGSRGVRGAPYAELPEPRPHHRGARMSTSRISGFKDLSVAERRARAAETAGLAPGALDVLDPDQGLGLDQADHMIENAVGVLGIPVGVATNFIVNGRELLVPMATEEPSVVAAASNLARMARDHGGFRTSSTPPLMQAQVQVLDVVGPGGRPGPPARCRRRADRPGQRAGPGPGGSSAAASVTSPSASCRAHGAPTSCCTSWSTCATPWARTPSTPWPRPSRPGSPRSPAVARCCGS